MKVAIYIGLTSIEIPNDAWSLDNLATVVPEPSDAALYAMALSVYLRWGRNK